jgi:hypothetical protein
MPFDPSWVGAFGVLLLSLGAAAYLALGSDGLF